MDLNTPKGLEESSRSWALTQGGLNALHIHERPLTSKPTTSDVSHISPSASRRRPLNRPQPPDILKRSVSTPNVRGLMITEVPYSSRDDKKRSKLGYHRTSIACGHCRRRKIRCYLALNDSSNRCTNCIRLKKDCQFSPVDQAQQQQQQSQQSQPVKRPKQVSKKETFQSEAETSTSTSPGASGEQGDDAEQALRHQHSDFFGHPYPTPLASMPYSSGAPMESPMISHGSKGSRDYSTSSFHESHPSWTSATSYSHLSPSFGSDLAFDDRSPSTYWGHSAHSSFQYPVDGTAIIPAPAIEGIEYLTSSSGGEEPGWRYHHAPQRSMSLANPNELQQYYQTHPLSDFHLNSGRHMPMSPEKPQSIHRPSLITTNGSPDRHMIHNPMSFGARTAPHHDLQTVWTSMASDPHSVMAMSGAGNYPHGWYTPPMALQQVDEESDLSRYHDPKPG